ncbi:MAG: phospholipid carrier-dependent glycosyltransferase [Verrucomicrobia bacterium]|nr:phospholipid carrier-dependent glycosyltransferase [Verrucomicrobiota bacterium]
MRSDLGGDPDEGAHAVTALMMKDYLTQGVIHGRSPMMFAERYYQTFPKVALGHYPPAYYLPAAVALMIWNDPRSLIVLQCVFAALLGLVMALITLREWPGAGAECVACIAGAAVVLNGEVARVSVHVLSDLLLVLLVVSAAVCWMMWLKQPSWKRSLLFGFLAAAAILTKGSALGLAGIPVFSLLLTRRWRDIKTLSWWAAGIPVAVLAGPWMLWSVRFTQEGFTGDSPAAFFVKAVGEYATMVPWFFGWPVLVVLSVVVMRTVVDVFKPKGGVNGFRATLISTCLGMQGIAMVVPAGFSPRYMLPSLIPVLVLVVLEVPRWLRESQKGLATALTVILLIVTTALLWRDRAKEVHGFAKAVDTVLAWPEAREQRAWLVSSDGRGEGALIAAAAFRTPDRIATKRRILRGSKEIADTDWGGRHYETKFPDDAALLAHLDKAEVDVVLVDLSMPAEEQKPHEMKLKQALDTVPLVWEKLPDQPVTRLAGASPRSLEMYRRTRPSP